MRERDCEEEFRPSCDGIHVQMDNMRVRPARPHPVPGACDRMHSQHVGDHISPHPNAECVGNIQAPVFCCAEGFTGCRLNREHDYPLEIHGAVGDAGQASHWDGCSRASCTRGSGFSPDLYTESERQGRASQKGQRTRSHRSQRIHTAHSRWHAEATVADSRRLG